MLSTIENVASCLPEARRKQLDQVDQEDDGEEDGEDAEERHQELARKVQRRDRRQSNLEFAAGGSLDHGRASLNPDGAVWKIAPHSRLWHRTPDRKNDFRAARRAAFRARRFISRSRASLRGRHRGPQRGPGARSRGLRIHAPTTSGDQRVGYISGTKTRLLRRQLQQRHRQALDRRPRRRPPAAGAETGRAC